MAIKWIIFGINIQNSIKVLRHLEVGLELVTMTLEE